MPRRSAASGVDETEERLERVTALVYALLHDVAAWLSGTVEPVDVAFYPEYRLRSVADLPEPRARMTRYLNPGVLESWGEVLDRWVSRGFGYRPSFGRNLRVAISDGPDEGPRAEVTFHDRSEVQTPNGDRLTPGRRWSMTVWVAEDLRQIRSVVLREVTDPPLAGERPPGRAL
ncbi:MAG: hypothetical protein J2P44_10250 [Candidatus Dormibacteraeota bacterium]|nr:hypothetical protein [Candidatus Dormibacteraeota bacterium]